MFEAKLQSADTFKKIIDSLQSFVNESNIDCNDAGMSLQCMDTGHVALVFLNLKAEGFLEYRCDRDIPLGVNFVSLNKILKCASPSDTLTMRAGDTADKANFVFENENSNRISEYEMKLLAIDTELLAIPDNDYDVTISMPSAELARICRDLFTISDSVTISAVKGEVRFAAEGDLGSGTITVKPTSSVDDEENEITVTVKNPSHLTVGLKFMNNFTKAAGLAKKVKIQLHDELPLLVEFELEKDLGILRYYLAPKGDDSEE